MEQRSNKFRIVIPYRDRKDHLEYGLQAWRMCYDRCLGYKNYEILIIEQDNDKPFNLGKLTNIGFDITQKELGEEQYTFVMSNADNYPSVIEGLHCKEKELKLFYAERGLYEAGKIFLKNNGKAGYQYFSINSKTYKDIGGYSNLFYGWGYEDWQFCKKASSQGVEIQLKMFKSVFRVINNSIEGDHPERDISRANLNEQLENNLLNGKVEENDYSTMFEYTLEEDRLQSNTTLYKVDWK